MNINIRDLIGPTSQIRGIEDSYEGIFEEVRTILRAWANLGPLDISDKVVFNLLTSWDVRNTGTAPGYAGLKVSIIETLGLLPDVTPPWWQYSPLSREGGPGKVQDFMYRMTGNVSGATVWGTPITQVNAGATVVLSCNFEIPGPLVNAATAVFWYDGHPTPTFKVGIEVLELVSLAGAHVRSLGDRTLTRAFELRAARVMAPALAVVGEPSIGWGLVLGGETPVTTPTTVLTYFAAIDAATTRADVWSLIESSYASLGVRSYSDYLTVYDYGIAKWYSLPY